MPEQTFSSTGAIMDDPQWLKDPNITTRSRNFFRDLLRIHDRIENQDAEVPPEIEFIRDTNDSLRRIEEHLREVRGNTEKLPSVIQLVLSVLKFGGSQAEHHFPKKK